MDVTITSTGRTFFQVDPTLCAILMEMFPEAIVKHNPRPQLKPEELVPQWYVCKNTYDDRLYYISFKQGARTMRYDGPPSQAAASFATNSVVVPEHILSEYRQLWIPRNGAPNAWWAEYEAIHGK
jgi:hypothetical protein